MDWDRIISAAGGRATALKRIIEQDHDDDDAALATLLLMEETPHPAAALVAAAETRRQVNFSPIQAALAPAAWRADRLRARRAAGALAHEGLTLSVAGMVGALCDDSVALRAAVDVVLRNGSGRCVERCLEALGADGWAMLNDQQRAALLTRAAADDLGWVWGALTEAQRAATTQRAAANPRDAAALIGRIGATAWQAADPTLREILMNAVLRDPPCIGVTAPAWAGMTAAERETLARAAMACDDAVAAFDLLDALGVVGRGALTVEQRAALERRAMESPGAWRVLAWRAADAGWTALSATERRAVLAAAAQASWIVPPLLRAIDVAGWRAMRDHERARIAVAVRHAPADLFACPPALWLDLAGADLPPATEIPWTTPESWRAEDADADLDGLPPAHQAVVLALAPWRTEDATKDSVRMQRLRAAWSALPDDARVALATDFPLALAPSVAAAARLGGGSGAVLDAVGETIAQRAAATDGAAARRIVGAMLRTPDDWRPWMASFAPTAADPPDVGKAWRAAARSGIIADLALCARLAALRGSPRSAARRGIIMMETAQRIRRTT